MKRGVWLLLYFALTLFGNDSYQLSHFTHQEYLTKYQSFFYSQEDDVDPFSVKEDSFQHHPSGVYGRIGGTLLSRIMLKNDTKEFQEFYLVHPRFGTDRIEIWIVDANNGKVETYHHLGDRSKLKERAEHTIKSSLKVMMEPGESKEIIASFRTTGVLEGNLIIQKTEEFHQGLKHEIIWWSFFSGVMLSLIFYNMTLFYVTKNRAYLVHSSYAFSILVLYTSLYGYLYYLDVLGEAVVDNMAYIAPKLGVAFHMLFPLVFFNIKERSRGLYNFFMFFIILFCLLGVWYVYGFFDERIYLYEKYMLPLIALTFFGTFLYGIYAYYKKLTASLMYLISQIFTVSSIFYAFFYVNGIVNHISLAPYFFTTACVVFEIIFVTIALSVKVKEIVREKEHYENVSRLYENYIYVGKNFTDIIHQWKRPLASLGSMSALLDAKMHHEEKMERNDIKEIADDLRVTVGNLAKIQNDVMSYMGQDDRRSTVNLKDIIETALSYTGKAQQDVEFVLQNVDQDMYVNKAALVQVLLILLFNSMENFERRKVFQREICIEAGLAERQWYIKFFDNGGGMKKQLLKKMFSPYVSSSIDGMGSGLFVAKKLVAEKLQGTLEVKNSESGLLFVIAFPADPVNGDGITFDNASGCRGRGLPSLLV